MKNLWQLLTQHHKEEIPNLIKLAQISLIIPLHTADCERTFSIQNQIVTPKRNRLDQEQCDKLIRIKVHGKGLDKHNFKSSLERWHGRKKMILKSRSKLTKWLVTIMACWSCFDNHFSEKPSRLQEPLMVLPQFSCFVCLLLEDNYKIMKYMIMYRYFFQFLLENVYYIN